MKRIVLFLGTNLAVLVVLGFFLNVVGVGHYLKQDGIDLGALLVFSAIVGFAGSFISLLMSKTMAKWSTGAQIVNGSEGSTEYWLVNTVRKLAERARIGMPQVAIGLLESMSREEAEAVLGHEVAHVANGDMVTLTLIQGVVNTFVIFLSRVVGFFVDRVLFKTQRGVGPGFYVAVIICDIVFGILASIIVAWFSRRREFRADAGSATLLGSPQPMMAALARLGGLEPGALPASFKSSGISNRSGLMALFSTHPPIEDRIAALQARD
jgi:heat shock protein HtpX